jgi:hypothetical protein
MSNRRLRKLQISEPGAYALYEPDADVLNAGRPAFCSSGRASRMSARNFRWNGAGQIDGDLLASDLAR